MSKFKDKMMLGLKIYFGTLPISYAKFFEHFSPIVKILGTPKRDYCQYRLTQVFDELNEPTEEFYYSNKSLGANTTYKPTNLKEFTKLYKLKFIERENNNGIFNKQTRTKVILYLGRKKAIVNSPYMIEIKFGDYIAVSNNLLMVIPRKMQRKLFRWW
jgi:hypothetical protein